MSLKEKKKKLELNKKIAVKKKIKLSQKIKNKDNVKQSKLNDVKSTQKVNTNKEIREKTVYKSSEKDN